MHPSIDAKRSEIAAACHRFQVRRLDVFGSAARGSDFDPASSDADFLVEFDQNRDLPPLEQFLGLAEALEKLLGRPVDLVERGAVENPYIQADINRSCEPLYAA